MDLLDPRTNPNSGPLFDRFRGSVLVPKCSPNRLQGTPKSEQKAQKRAKTSSKWLCISSSSALRKSYKNTVFYDGFSASKLSKTTPKEPKGAHEAILYAQKRPRRQHKSHSDSEFRNGPEKDTKKTPKRVPETSPKSVRIEVRKRVRKWRAIACSNQRTRIPGLDHVRALILCNA